MVRKLTLPLRRRSPNGSRVNELAVAPALESVESLRDAARHAVPPRLDEFAYLRYDPGFFADFWPRDGKRAAT